MRSTSHLTILLCLLAPLLGPHGEASAALARSLTFRQGLGMVLEQGVDVRRAHLDAEGADAASRAAHRAWQPDLSLGASSSERIDRQGATSSLDASLQSSMALWRGGELRGRRRAAEAEAASAHLLLDRARQDVAWVLARAWIELDQARARLSVARASSELEATTLERIRAMMDAGARTRADLAAQQASVAEASASIAQAEGNVSLAELSLVYLLRLEPTEVWAFEPLEDRPAIRGTEARALLDDALRVRPDLSAFAAGTESADAAVAIARAGRLPSVDLGAGLSTGWNSGAQGTVAGQLDDGVGGALTLQVQVPLWDRGATRSAVDQAQVSRERADLVLDDARREVLTEVLAVLERQRTATAVLEATTARLAAAEEAEALTRRRFEAGAAALVELAQARSMLEDARQSEVTARYDVLSLEWELAWTTGAIATP